MAGASNGRYVGNGRVSTKFTELARTESHERVPYAYATLKCDRFRPEIAGCFWSSRRTNYTLAREQISLRHAPILIQLIVSINSLEF